MDTIRTTGKYGDYFIDNWTKYAKKENKHIYLGHYHIDLEYPKITLIGSSGYDGKYKILRTATDYITIEPDIHLGLPQTRENIKRMIDRWERENYTTIILLGDFLEMQEYSDKDLQRELYDLGFFNFLRKSKSNVIYIYGNHDINIKGSNLGDLLESFGVSILEKYENKSMEFAHGHKYDVHIEKWGKLKYYLIYKIGDYLNLPKKIINYLVRKFK